MSSFWRGLVIQWRVLGALLIREIYSRFGRESLGFAWIVAEPLVFALPVLFMWRAIIGSQEHGLAVMPFLWSGYLPLLLFRHLGGRILLFIRANVPLLYHRRVAIFDIFLARALLETFSNLTALVVSFAVFYAVGSVDVPRDLPMFYLGYFYIIWWAVASALIIGALCERTDWVGSGLDAFLLHVHDLLRFLLSRRLAAARPAQRGPLSTLYAVIRDDPRRGLRYDDYDLWRPHIPNSSSQS
jgi:capsular polysaccharide transport system permease protein